jgi:hypothetical protein
LRGLRGEADTNRDNDVTLGELTGYVRQKSPGRRRLSSTRNSGPCCFPHSSRMTQSPRLSSPHFLHSPLPKHPNPRSSWRFAVRESNRLSECTIQGRPPASLAIILDSVPRYKGYGVLQMRWDQS